MKTPETIIQQRKGSTFVPRKISKALRNDYDKYLMGQKQLQQIVKLRRKNKYEVTRIFEILYHEKRYTHQKLQQ